MYKVQINPDNTVSNLETQNISVGYKDNDWFYILSDTKHNGIYLQNYRAYIEYTLPITKNLITERIYLNRELSTKMLNYEISSNSGITAERGVVIATILFKDSKSKTVRSSKKFNIYIDTTEPSPDPDPTPSPTPSCVCTDDDVRKKAKPLTFETEADALTAINSGTIVNAYLGMEILIHEGDNYTPYTMQLDEHGNYHIEPMNGFDGGSYVGAYWIEDERE